MHIDNVIFLILSKNAYTKFSAGPYANVLVILTIFVALFSFLTTNISLSATSATIEQYFIFNALMLGCISFLVALLGMVIKPRRKSLVYWIPAVICFVVAFGLYVL